jgi:hypothetical protein
MESRVQDDLRSYEGLNISGYIGTTVYRMDANSNEYFMAVVFEDKETYFRNANDPRQDARYREFVAYLDGEPEWHDGEIVYRA